MKMLKKLRILKYKLLSTASSIYGSAKLIQACQMNGNGTIVFHHNVQIGYDPSPFLYSGYGYIEARNKKSKIELHDNIHINNNVTLISEGEGIFIGANTLIGTNCEIYDSDFHNLEVEKRITGKPLTAKVEIEENVFIGSGVTILKGVKIGKNSVIANGSIVTKSIPENVVAGGIPAKVIRNL